MQKLNWGLKFTTQPSSYPIVMNYKNSVLSFLQQDLKYNSPSGTFFGLPHVGKGAAGSSAHLINLIHKTRKRGYL
jgi:hypothetical protein